MRKRHLISRIKSSGLGLPMTLAACLLGFICSLGIQAQGGGALPIEGTWLVTVSTAGGVPPPFPALITYSAGGGMVVTDSSFPPTRGNVYQGTWARKSDREFVFTFLGFQYTRGVPGRGSPPSGVHSGFVRVLETVTLDSSGDSYRGVAVFQLLDLNGNVVFSEPNTTTASRVKTQ